MFQLIFKDPRYSTGRPILLETDKGKEFLNRHIHDMLKREGILFQVCRNPDVKCSVAEGAHGTIRDRLYKYFTYTNKYRYVDVLPKFAKAYNDTVHSDSGMAPSRFNDSDFHAICKKMEQGGVAFASSGRDSVLATRAHRQRKNLVCGGHGAEFQHRDISGL